MPPLCLTKLHCRLPHQFRDEDRQVVMKLPTFNEPIGFLHDTPQNIPRGLSDRGPHDREQARFTEFFPLPARRFQQAIRISDQSLVAFQVDAFFLVQRLREQPSTGPPVSRRRKSREAEAISNGGR